MSIPSTVIDRIYSSLIKSPSKGVRIISFRNETPLVKRGQVSHQPSEEAFSYAG